MINTYLSRKKIGENKKPIFSEDLDGKSESSYDSSDSSKSEVDEDNSGVTSTPISSASLKERGLTVEFLEDETDVFQGVDDWDGTIFIYHGSLFLSHFWLISHSAGPCSS